MTDPENQDFHQEERRRLTSLLTSIRRKIFRQDFFDSAIKTATIIFPVTAVGVAINQFSGSPFQSSGLILVSLGITVAVTTIWAVFNMKAHFGAAVALDSKAELQDRVTSALQFLNRKRPANVPERLQIEDALEQAQQVNAAQLFRLRLLWVANSNFLRVAVASKSA